MAAVAACGLAGLGLAGGVAPAQAGCGGVQTAQPTSHRGPGLPPLAIGDSTMLLALPDLAREGFAVNAHGCREYDEALALLRQLRDGGALPHLVVVALGADGSVTSSDVEQTLSILGHERVLVLVTPRELGGGSGSDAETVRREGRLHPQTVHVLDWVAYAQGHGGDWFQPDGLHLTFSGAAVFARFLGRALAFDVPAGVVVSGAARVGAASGASSEAVSFRARVVAPFEWSSAGRRERVGLPQLYFVTGGRCVYRLRVAPSVTVAPASSAAAQVRSLVPLGTRASSVAHKGGVEAWTAWRAREFVGGALALDLGAAPGAGGHAFLDWMVTTVRGAHCHIVVSRAAQGQILGLLAGLRTAPRVSRG